MNTTDQGASLQAMIQANRERDKSHPRLSNMERASILGVSLIELESLWLC
jgi:hypothetical protein